MKRSPRAISIAGDTDGYYWVTSHTNCRLLRKPVHPNQINPRTGQNLPPCITSEEDTLVDLGARAWRTPP